MVYVQYYTTGKISPKLVGYTEVLGDRGVVILDGRTGKGTWHRDAIEYNGFQRPVFEAYRLFKGRSFLDSQPISGIIPF